MKKTITVQALKNEIFKGSVWIWGIAGRSTALWMKQAKSFWNKNCRRHRKR